MDPERFALGLVVILAGFAIKSGVGLYMGLFAQNAFPKRGRLLLLYPSIYLTLFLGLGLLWVYAQDLKVAIHLILSYGAEIHILVSLFFMYLGIRFLLVPNNMATSKRWLVLLIPCPICAVTVFMSLGILISFFPQHELTAIFFSYGVFMSLGTLTLAVMYLCVKHRVIIDLNLLLGLILIFTSLYTIAVLLISEGYMQSGRVINIASNKSNFSFSFSNNLIIISFVICILAFLLGFIKKRSY